MAIKIPGAKRGDIYFVNPFEVVVREDLRGRWEAPTPEEIVKLAMSIYDHQQKQPISGRAINGVVNAVAGFTRTAAIRLIREGFTGTDGVYRCDPERTVHVKLMNCNDEDALITNIIENEHRNEATDVDAAFNQEKLRESYGKSNKEIAELYGYKDTQKVLRLAKLLQLESDVLHLIHSGDIGTQAGLEMLELSPEERAKIVEDANAGKKISGAEITDQVREHHLRDNPDKEEGEAGNDTEEKDDKKVKYKARSVRNLRKFFETTGQEEFDPAIKAFCKSTLKYIAGKTTDRQMLNAMNKLLKAEETPWEYEAEVKEAA